MRGKTRIILFSLAFLLAALFISQLGVPAAQAADPALGRWKVMPIVYCVNHTGVPKHLDGGPIITEQAFVKLVREAFGLWENLPGSKVRSEYAGPCDHEAMAPKEDGFNVIGWASRTNNNQGAVTRLYWSEETLEKPRPEREIAEADIVINNSTSKIRDDVGEYVREVLPHLLMHEIGHLIGLGHSSANCSVMFPFGIRDVACQDDIDAVAALYR